jgi:hypothetical protein
MDRAEAWQQQRQQQQQQQLQQHSLLACLPGWNAQLVTPGAQEGGGEFLHAIMRGAQGTWGTTSTVCAILHSSRCEQQV